MLRPPNVLLETLLEIVSERFVNVRSLILDNIRKVDDEDLAILSNLSTWTILDVTPSHIFYQGYYRHWCGFPGKSECLKQNSF